MNPLRRRWIILGLIFAAIVLNYVDRQILSILKPTFKTGFGFDDRGYVLLINVFTIAYAVMYLVAGWLVDRFGARMRPSWGSALPRVQWCVDIDLFEMLQERLRAEIAPSETISVLFQCAPIHRS